MATQTYYDRVHLEALTGLSDSLVQRRLRALAEAVLNRWQVEARIGLNTTANEYIRNLSLADFDGKQFKVVLSGTVPNMMEQGMGPGGVGTTGRYDLRTMILKAGTRGLRRAKDGRLYVNINFRHGAASLKEEGYSGQAKRLNPTLTTGQMWRPPGSNLVDPKAQQARVFHMKDGHLTPGFGGRLGPEAGERKKWWWHSPHLAGLVRMQATYSKAAQSHYSTWRRIIEWSPHPTPGEEAKWWHPGIVPHHFAEKVMLRMDEMIKAFFGEKG